MNNTKISIFFIIYFGILLPSLANNKTFNNQTRKSEIITVAKLSPENVKQDLQVQTTNHYHVGNLDDIISKINTDTNSNKKYLHRSLSIIIPADIMTEQIELKDCPFKTVKECHIWHNKPIRNEFIAN